MSDTSDSATQHAVEETKFATSSAIKRMEHAQATLQTIAKQSSEQVIHDAVDDAMDQLEDARSDLRHLVNNLEDLAGDGDE